MNNMLKNDTQKRGFTLAETLITITIIGVVMALMLRAINRVNPDKDKIQFIKTYHALESVIADVINDPKKYDQAFYTDEELAEMTADSIHIDFRYKPYETAKVTYIDDDGKEHTKGLDSQTGKGTALTQDNAICYFIADQVNTIGVVNCENNDGITINGKKVGGANMRLSTGVCLNNFYGVDDNGFNNPVIDPNCEGTGSNNAYVIHIYKDGKMTVPSKSACNSNGGDCNTRNQDKAFEWMQNQTQLNDKK